jgi:hypothetical protein
MGPVSNIITIKSDTEEGQKFPIFSQKNANMFARERAFLSSGPKCQSEACPAPTGTDNRAVNLRIIGRVGPVPVYSSWSLRAYNNGVKLAIRRDLENGGRAGFISSVGVELFAAINLPLRRTILPASCQARTCRLLLYPHSLRCRIGLCR